MSIRQRIPFRFSDDTHEEDIHILDEQEQEELIQRLKDDSVAHNAQYFFILQVLIGLSSILQVIYLLKSEKEPPITPLLSTTPLAAFTPIPLTDLWTVLNLVYHVNLTIHLLPSTHPIRRQLQQIRTSPYSSLIPLAYPFLYGLSVLPAFLSLMLNKGWIDIIWWLATPAMVYVIHSAQRWIVQESDGIQNLENLRYNAKGA